MLEEDHSLRDRALRDRARKRALQIPRLAVRQSSGLKHVRAAHDGDSTGASGAYGMQAGSGVRFSVAVSREPIARTV